MDRAVKRTEAVARRLTVVAEEAEDELAAAEAEVAAAVVADRAATAAAGWMAFAGSGEMSGEAKNACRRRWRAFICSGRIEPPRRPKTTTAPAGATPAAAGVPATMPKAPDGVPAHGSSAYINWFDRQPGWMHARAGAVLYAGFIKEWVTRAEEAAEAAIAAAAEAAAAVG